MSTVEPEGEGSLTTEEPKGQGPGCDSGPNEDLVVAPGGPRPRQSTHHVGPSQLVHEDDEGNLTVRPHIDTEPVKGTTRMSDELVLTPGGYRRSSLVNHVEPGHVIDMTEGTLRKLDRAGNERAVYGRPPKHDPQHPLMPKNLQLPAGRVAALASGWIAYTGWTNNSGHPLTSFSTTWVVPPAPSTHNGQTVFLFNGIQNSTMIFQPVLQWGPSAAGDVNGWGVACWYADGQGGQSFYSTLVGVRPGDVITGVMTLTGQLRGRFSYRANFTGIAHTDLTITNVDELTWCNETLEAYGMTRSTDYPDTGTTRMHDIAITTQDSTPSLGWLPVDAVVDVGQSVNVVSNSSTNGEVDLNYRTIYSGPTATGDSIQSGQVLRSGDAIHSASGRYTFVYQGDGNLVLYDGGHALWASNTNGRPIGICIMQGDGNLVIYSPNGGNPIWASKTDGRPGSHLVLQDDGNVVVYQPNGHAAWSTNTWLPTGPTATGDRMQPGEVLNPGDAVTSANERYRFIYQGDGNLVLYDGGHASWASNTSGRPVGVAIMQRDGNLVLYGRGGRALWASNTSAKPGSHLVVQNDRNVVIYQPDGHPVWATNTNV